MVNIHLDSEPQYAETLWFRVCWFVGWLGVTYLVNADMTMIIYYFMTLVAKLGEKVGKRGGKLRWIMAYHHDEMIVISGKTQTQ